MVKVYYSYAYEKTVGQFASRVCNFAIDATRRLIVTGTNQYIALISAKSGQIVAYLNRPNRRVPVRHIKLGNGKIYAGYEDGEISVWDIDSRQMQSSFDLHKSSVSSIQLSEDETHMVSGGLDGHIILWDLLSEQHHLIKSAHSNAITQVDCANVLFQGRPTGIIISVGKDGFVKVWSMETHLCLAALSTHATQARSFHYNSVRSLIYVGTNREDVVLIRINEHDLSAREFCEVVAVFKRKNYSPCQSLLVQYDRMYLMNGDKKIEIYELLNDSKLKAKKKRAISRLKAKTNVNQSTSVSTEQPVTEVQSINQYLLHLSFLSEKVLPFKVYNFEVAEQKIYLNNGNDIIEAEGDRAITNSNQKTLQLQLGYPFLIQRNHRNLQVYSYGSFQHLFSISKKVSSCCLFSNGFLMLVEDSQVTVWDLAKNEAILQMQETWSGCWVFKNKCVLWRQNEVGFYDIGLDKKGKTKMRQTSCKYYDDKIISAMYTHTQEKYVVNMQNSQMGVHFADTHKQFLKLYGHKMPVCSFDISSDNALLASGSLDKDIRLWDMDFGHSIKTIFAHAQAVSAVRFLADTHYLLSGGKDGHIKFWDADTHQLLFDLDENILQVKSIVATPAADQIIAGGLDGGFRVWKITSDQTVATDQEERALEKVLIEEYAENKLKANQAKTRYEDLKHGQQIIEALEKAQQPQIVLGLLRKIPPANLQACLSFLHGHHVARLENYLGYFVSQRHEQELCWRVLEALGHGSNLGQSLRSSWQQLTKILRVNREALSLLSKTLQQQKLFLS